MPAELAASTSDSHVSKVLVIGGAGYVGSVLVPKLLMAAHDVTVLDLFIYGDDVFGPHADNPQLKLIKGDMRDAGLVAKAMQGQQAVIHLACISNDPSFDLDPELGRSINYDCFRPNVRAAKEAGVRRFVYASSSSVYGVKEEDNVTEELPLQPLTDYSRFKAMCEDVLHQERAPGFTTLIIRPATVCGYGRRLRLDLTVNILTTHAVTNGVIKVFGGAQRRPNIHIEDMTDLYVEALRHPDALIDGQVFNAGYENFSIQQLAEMVRETVAKNAEIVVSPTSDLRSYHISSQRIAERLGFRPKHSLADASRSVAQAIADGRVSQPLTNPLYYNIHRMKALALR